MNMKSFASNANRYLQYVKTARTLSLVMLSFFCIVYIVITLERGAEGIVGRSIVLLIILAITILSYKASFISLFTLSLIYLFCIIMGLLYYDWSSWIYDAYHFGQLTAFILWFVLVFYMIRGTMASYKLKYIETH